MGKGQKGVSLPKEYWKELDDYFKENEQLLKILNIESTADLVRTLSRLGKPTLQQLLDQVTDIAEKHVPPIQETIVLVSVKVPSALSVFA